MLLRTNTTGRDWIFLAMAHWRLGRKDEARGWYARTLALMEEHSRIDEELCQIREEAEMLLGIETNNDK